MCKLIRISTSYSPRRCGMSHHVEALSLEQVANGSDVTVIHPNGSLRRRVPGLTEIGVSVKQSLRERSIKGFRLCFYARVARLMRSKPLLDRCRLLHGHGDVSDAIAMLVMAAAVRKPLIMTIHGGLARGKLHGIVARLVWPRVDGIIAVSQEIADTLAEYGVSGSRVEVISSGIDTEWFRPPSASEREAARAALGIQEHQVCCVAVGRMTAVKGHTYLIEAVKLLRGSGAPVRLTIVGDGPLRGALEARCATTDSVRLAGETSHESVRQHLWAADIFVLPSIDLESQREGTPTAVMEAMATGLPVIVTDSGGSRSIVCGPSEVVVVEQRNSPALVSSIESLVANPELRKSIGSANHERALGRSWQRQAKRVRAFYDVVCPRGLDG